MVNRLTPYQIREIGRLTKLGASMREIALTLKIAKSTVYYHAKSLCRKMTTFDSSCLSECERGYIIGLFLADGSFNRGLKNPRYFVRFALDSERDQDVAKNVSQIFAKAQKKVSIFRREHVLTIKVCSKELIEYVKGYVEYAKSNDGKSEKVILQGKQWSHDFKLGVLAGIIDGDGHVHEHLSTEIKMVSKKIFGNVLNIIHDLGMIANTKVRKATRNSYSKKPCHAIYIPSSEMKKHNENIPSVKIKRFR
jgi:hypothetical protein